MNVNCAGVYPRNNATLGQDSDSYPCRLGPRFAFIASASAALLLLRCIDPVLAGSSLPFHPSCGAITGLPCIFCGMTRALHLLLNGDFIGAIYFNWLAFPFLGAIIFLWVTRWRLTVFGLGLLLLWTLQTYLAVSQHKHELLNTRGPLYVLFAR